MKKGVLCLVLFLVASMVFAGGRRQEGAGPDGFPTRPITFLVGFGPGGPMDVTARAVIPTLERLLGTTINVVNRPGANSWIAYEELARARPDGYTLAIFAVPGLFGFHDPRAGRTVNLDSFQLIGNVVTDPNSIIVRTGDTRFNTIQDVINHARTTLTVVKYSGIGSDDDYTIKLVQRETGIRMQEVPSVAGWMEVLPALLGGHVDIAVSNVGESLNTERAGEVRTLVTFSAERTPFTPHVPTWNESGFGSEILMAAQRGFMMPAGGDPRLVRFLSDKLLEAMNTQEVIDNLYRLGMFPHPMSAEEVTADVRRQEAVAADMIELMFGN